ncbi:TPA: ferrous iron transport protein B [Clostridium perfringens]|jgi:ferrous iron transport protein B|uniref:ferrous iron transport protein B n=1 Tax=Clostridium perfringens TaxID=1502 RepID=UPI0013E2BF8A|nr:ferrous iron transport protein B [Clostridium perfringens]MDK0590493.1 ferrous iron transport protein B [Clostridium perfringens]MDK0592969.1 ferrous iron transport protein B [Clostridium perfringens]MDK0610539.1 ferrous iron transport protein B [Clostridium perfringens]MDK0644321.1 ferrous iron transport protein B [Clostridium perfringens]MDK0688657.1 ferrous iron transport protein B [Clostridium perfringens]
MLTIALAGNPNCGKTSLFNLLTKSRQHIGNWPGVTVEKKEGTLKFKGESYKVIDLPGTYSLGAYSEDEIVARNYILKDKPDVVINVVDATNLERNLYLTTQLIEMGANVVIALNMIDQAESLNIEIDTNKLSKRLGVPIIKTSALKNRGIEELIETSIHSKKNEKLININYGEDIENEIKNLSYLLEAYKNKLEFPVNWTALKLLENDEYIKDKVKQLNSPSIFTKLEESNKTIEKNIGFEADMSIVDKRYSFISSITEDVIKKPSKKQVTTTEKIDKIVTNKYLGIPIFALIMYCLYELTFIIGAGIQEWFGDLIAKAGVIVSDFIANMGAPELLVGFINDGLFGGVGAVLSFLPLIMVMYFLLGLLEDSGYMARAAYVMDRFMRGLGLHGKTFVSMIVSVGCNVPGIMSTRTLENKKDRMIAILINPFISCGARMPIYAVFVEAFFPTHQGLVLFSLYVLGIIVALISGKIFSKTLFKGESSYFVMELPAYRMPSIKNVFLLMWEKAGAFFKKAGMIIFPMMIVLWALSVLPLGVEPNSEHSILGMIGSFVAPLFVLAGYGTWQAGVSLITGILAKESVVATMGMVYAGVEEGEALINVIQQVFTPLSAISFLVMTLLYTPCLAALGAIKRETNSMKWTIFSAVYTFVIALVLSTLVYQVGLLLGFQ